MIPNTLGVYENKVALTLGPIGGEAAAHPFLGITHVHTQLPGHRTVLENHY